MKCIKQGIRKAISLSNQKERNQLIIKEMKTLETRISSVEEKVSFSFPNLLIQ